MLLNPTGPPRRGARARLWNRARGLAIQTTLVGAVAAAVLLALPAVAAADTEWHFQGSSVKTGDCQADVVVDFHATVHHGHFKEVSRFAISHANFPNKTPPVLFGQPTGDCLPGERSFVLQDYDLRVSAVIGFTDPDHPNEFNGSSQYPSSSVATLGQAQEAWILGGVVHIRRVRHHHHRVFRAKAHGDFGFAVSEGGLKYGGSSTGQVNWVARGKEE